MEKAVFVTRYASASNIVDNTKVKRVLRDSIESNIEDGNPRGHRNLIIVNEELAELAKEISKELRGKGDRWDTLQELADVIICTNYIKDICGFSEQEVNRAINVKINNLENELKENGVYL